MTYHHIKADGTIEEVKPKKGKHFTYEEQRSLVGGMIEFFPLTNGDEILLNEEGLLINLPFNEIATRICDDSYKGKTLDTDWKAHIVGDVVYHKKSNSKINLSSYLA